MEIDGRDREREDRRRRKESRVAKVGGERPHGQGARQERAGDEEPAGDGPPGADEELRKCPRARVNGERGSPLGRPAREHGEGLRIPDCRDDHDHTEDRGRGADRSPGASSHQKDRDDRGDHNEKLWLRQQ